MTNEQEPAARVVNEWLTEKMAADVANAVSENDGRGDLGLVMARAALPPLVLRATFDELAASQRAMDDLNASACGSMAREINALRARVAELQEQYDGVLAFNVDWRARVEDLKRELETHRTMPAPTRELEPDYWRMVMIEHASRSHIGEDGLPLDDAIAEAEAFTVAIRRRVEGEEARHG